MRWCFNLIIVFLNFVHFSNHNTKTKKFKFLKEMLKIIWNVHTHTSLECVKVTYKKLVIYFDRFGAKYRTLKFLKMLIFAFIVT